MIAVILHSARASVIHEAGGGNFRQVLSGRFNPLACVLAVAFSLEGTSRIHRTALQTTSGVSNNGPRRAN